MSTNRGAPSSAADDPGGLAESEIRAQLERILAHPAFEATERLRGFLAFVVEESLAGRAGRIKGRLIARRVFDRGEDFDPNRDPVVRIEAGRLRRRLEHYYFTAGRRDPVRIEIPKGRYVPRFTRQAVGRAEPTSTPDGPPLPEEGPTIAVLPFRDLTADPEQAFFVNGLVDELVNEVNRYESVTAVPCQPPPGGATGPGTPGRVETSGARFLLEGSVRRDAAELKMSAQLTDAVAVRQVWGTSYKVPLEAATLIATQEELARDVIAAIAGEYGVIARRLTRESGQKPPSELGTYDALLRYHHYMLVMTPAAGERALRALRRATGEEPDYGPAWAALANLHAHAWTFDLPGFEAPLETALEHARRGAALAPDSQLARTILAYVHLLRGDMERFGEEAEVALALNPGSPNFSGTIGYLLACAGEYERGAALLRQAIARNPCHPRWFHHGLFLVHFERGEYDEALREADQVGHQVAFWDPALRAAALGKLGRGAEAEASIRELRRLKPDFERRVRELLPRSVASADVREEFLDGLRMAGLRIEG